MSIQKLFIFFTTTLLVTFSLSSYAGLVRRIENNSNFTWTIVVQPIYSFQKIIFDKSNQERIPACVLGSILVNGPCLLPPGQTTYMTIYNGSNLVTADLVFTDGISKAVRVEYSGEPGHLKTKISNPQIIKDDKKGNLFIFDFPG